MNFLCVLCLESIGLDQALPRLLPCLHTVCWKCAEDIIQLARENCDDNESVITVSCVICLEVFQFPLSFEANQLPVDYTAIEDTSRPALSPYCAIHESHIVELFCRVCDQQLCGECVVLHPPTHRLLLTLEEYVLDCRLKLEAAVTELEVELEVESKIQEALAQVLLLPNLLSKRQAMIKAQVNTTFDQYIIERDDLKPALLSRRDAILLQLNQIIEADTKTANLHQEMLELSMQRLLLLQNHIATLFNRESALKYLEWLHMFNAVWPTLKSLMEPKVRETIVHDSLRFISPLCLAWFLLEQDTELSLITNNLGRLVHSRDFSLISKPRYVFGTKGGGRGHFRGCNGIVAVSDNDLCVCETGNRRLQLITVEGDHIRFLRPSRVSLPRRVAYSLSGDLIIADTNADAIVVCSPLDGEFKQKSFCRYPLGVCVHPITGDIIVGSNHHPDVDEPALVYMFTSISYNVKWQSNGLKLLSAVGVAVAVTGEIIVCDNVRSSIQLLSPEDGHFLRQFGTRDDYTSSLNEPDQIVVSQDNMLLVSERYGVSIWDIQRGERVHYFGGCGQLPGEFLSASGITITSDGSIAVTDWYLNRVQVF